MIKPSITRAVNGLTLLELLITLFIVSLLSTWAYWQATQYSIRAKRKDALTGLFIIQAYFEQQFNLDNVYPVVLPAKMKNSHYYTYTLTAITPIYFKITATPLANTSQINDKACPSFSLDSTGNQTAGTGSSFIQNQTCWQQAL